MINIIFDYDGTLHNSLEIYAKAFRKINKKLIEKNLINNREYTDEEISKWLGFSVIDMWKDYGPDLKTEEIKKYSNLIGKEMNRLINLGEAKLYKNTEATLKILKEKEYNLIFLSNCKVAYMECHREKFELDRFFSEYYCSEEYNFIPKYKIFEKIKEKNNGDFIIVGDRYQDIEIGLVHNVVSIGCEYGYGNAEELNLSDYKIKDISEIINILVK